MSNLGVKDYGYEVSAGRVSGVSVVNKFGRNENFGTAVADVGITAGLVTRLFVWPTAASTIEAISTSTNDTAAGTGARTIVVEGLNASWQQITETLTMNGTSASTASTQSFIRVFRAYVKTAGAYSTTTAGGNAGTITVRISGGGNALIAIYHNGTFGLGQSEVTKYTVPAGKRAFVPSISVSVDSVNPADWYFWNRKNADTVAAPFDSRRVVTNSVGVASPERVVPFAPFGPFPAKTDLWFSAIGANAGSSIEVNYTIILEDV